MVKDQFASIFSSRQSEIQTLIGNWIYIVLSAQK